MQNFYKYLTQSDNDLKWGTALTVVGYTKVLRNSEYPPLVHPPTYRFRKQNERKLLEYQIIYITEGEGWFESEKCKKQKIRKGTVIFLYPDNNHNYGPNINTGWTEYYIGLNGDYIDQLISKGFLAAEKAIFEIGFNEKITRIFTDIFQYANEERPNYQKIISAMSVYLLSEVIFFSANNSVEVETQQLIQRVKVFVSENLSQKINWHNTSMQFGFSYSKIRKLFKSYVGISLGQYQMQVKVNKARELLNNPHYTIKEVADTLGFQNEYYFNTFFKEKVGVPPGLFRKNINGQ